jgi:formamidopyrimidine-DNA glycosylase
VPELPEVETYRRFFAAHASGKAVRDVVVPDPAIVRNTSPRSVGTVLRGRRFEQPGRHGKWLVCPAGGPALLFHFGMTGDLIWSGDEPSRHRHDRMVLVFDDGELRYRNMRRLGGVWLARDEVELYGLLGGLGPDALNLDRDRFRERLSRRRGGVKAALMDQRFVAGVGNLVADEILWQARIHSRRRVEDLDARERARLFRSLRRVLREAVQEPDYLEKRKRWLGHVRGLPGARCPRCRTPLERAVVAGRTTYFCPSCQPRPPDVAG